MQNSDAEDRAENQAILRELVNKRVKESERVRRIQIHRLFKERPFLASLVYTHRFFDVEFIKDCADRLHTDEAVKGYTDQIREIELSHPQARRELIVNALAQNGSTQQANDHLEAMLYLAYMVKRHRIPTNGQQYATALKKLEQWQPISYERAWQHVDPEYRIGNDISVTQNQENDHFFITQIRKMACKIATESTENQKIPDTHLYRRAESLARYNSDAEVIKLELTEWIENSQQSLQDRSYRWYDDPILHSDITSVRYRDES